MTFLKKFAILSVTALALAGCQDSTTQSEEESTSAAETSQVEESQSSDESSQPSEESSQPNESEGTSEESNESEETTSESEQAGDAETGESSANAADSGNTEETTSSVNSGVASSEDSDITAVYEEIVSLDPELTEADMSTYSFMNSTPSSEGENANYIQIEIRQDNPTGDVSSSLGLYHYYPETETIEKQDIITGEFNALN